MVNQIDDIYDEAANKWRTNKGIGTVILSEPLDVMKFVVSILDKMLDKTVRDNKKLLGLIIVEDLAAKCNIIYYLENHSKHNEEFQQLIADKYLNVFTRDYIERSPYKPSPNDIKDILITINVVKFKKIIERYGYDLFKFRLLVNNEQCKVASDGVLMYKYAPNVFSINYSKLVNIAVNSPVKEFQVGCTLTNTDRETYDKYTDYISDSVTIFGDFSKLDECRVGNAELNISAETCRVMIAESNGWRAHMDMNDPLSKSIDDLYNPVALAERVSQTYNIIRERSNIVANNRVKLEKILEIVKDNIGKRILIISKSGEFAGEITDYLNANIEYSGKAAVDGEIFDTSLKCIRYDYCGNYHNDMQPVVCYDKDGKPKVFKSGKSIGKPVVAKAQAQRSRNLKLFNDDYMKVLSANNSIDKTFNGVVDVVIFTSPLCIDIRDLKYRIPNMVFSTVPNIIYKVYMRETIESKKLEEEKGGKNYEIVKDSEIGFVIGDF